MDTWIRTQDKNSITNGTITYYCSKYNPPYMISVIFPNSHELTLGVYNTKERAEDVMDRLWNTLILNGSLTMPEN